MLLKNKQCCFSSQFIRIILTIILLFTIFSGCSLFGTSTKNQTHDERSIGTTPSRYTKTLKYDFETTWSAVIVSLDGLPLEKVDKENGIIKTGWIEGWSQRKARGILTDRFTGDYRKERHRSTLDISGNNQASFVSVRCQIQEKSRGGSSAYRWERKASNGEKEEEILAKIEDILSGREEGL